MVAVAEGQFRFWHYLAIARTAAGDCRVACGTLTDNIGEFAALAVAVRTYITNVSLRAVYEATLAAAAKAGVDLGAPFTRPEGHPDHREWFAEVQVHRGALGRAPASA